MALSPSPKSLACLADALILLALAAVPAQAAHLVGGGMGATSRATIGIKVSVATRLEIRRSEAGDVGSGTADLAGQPFCVSASAGMGTYSIRAVDVSDGSSGQFPYAVEWAGHTGMSAQPALPLGPGALVTGLAPTVHGACSLAARLVVRPASLAGSPATSGGRALLLVIAPD